MPSKQHTGRGNKFADSRTSTLIRALIPAVGHPWQDPNRHATVNTVDYKHAALEKRKADMIAAQDPNRLHGKSRVIEDSENGRAFFGALDTQNGAARVQCLDGRPVVLPLSLSHRRSLLVFSRHQ